MGPIESGCSSTQCFIVIIITIIINIITLAAAFHHIFSTKKTQILYIIGHHTHFYLHSLPIEQIDFFL